MSLRAIVFDFDGVIANSEPLHLRAYQEVLAREHLALTADDYYSRYLGYDDAGAFAAIATDRGRRWNADAIARLVAEKARRLEALERDTSVLFPGAADAMRRAAAVAPIAIASGALGPEIRRVLEREQLLPLVSVIVSAEDTPISKPAPEPYALAVARLAERIDGGCAPRNCVAIEDSIWGLESAAGAGLRTVAVAQTYDRAALGSADLVIDRIADLDLHAIAQLCT